MKNISGTEITLFYCKKNSEHEDELVHGRESSEKITNASGYYEAYISGKNKAFYKSIHEPTDEELLFQLNNFINSPINKILNIFKF